MSSHAYDYLDGNAAAGELSKIFAVDLTTAEGRCAHCGAKKHFAEAHLYTRAPGFVARCPVCEQVLVRLVSIRQHVFLDMRGVTYLCLDITQLQESSKE
jgi:NAD-dependent SIR2 family protein deacetylase